MDGQRIMTKTLVPPAGVSQVISHFGCQKRTDPFLCRATQHRAISLIRDCGIPQYPGRWYANPGVLEVEEKRRKGTLGSPAFWDVG